MNNKLKQLAGKNIYTYDVAQRIISCTTNRLVGDVLKDIWEVDPIENYDLFAKKIIQWKNRFPKGKVIQKTQANSEGLRYGHFYSLAHYAGLDSFYLREAPRIEHGINAAMHMYDKTQIQTAMAFVFQSSFKRKMILQENPLKPVFSIGPIIHYAQSFYGKEKLEEIKRRYGRTVLVFLSHTYEAGDMKLDEDRYVDKIMNKVASEFDTVLFSVYWNDVDNPICKKFQDRGAVLVSNGFRDDPRFLGRLKSLLLLSDKVCGNDFGSHIGYGLHLNRDFEFIDTNLINNDEIFNSTSDLDNYSVEMKNVKRIFGDGVATESEKEAFLKKYWGGTEDIKSRQEMRYIFDFTRQLVKKSKGNTGAFDRLVKEQLSLYQKDDFRGDLLREALGLI